MKSSKCVATAEAVSVHVCSHIALYFVHAFKIVSQKQNTLMWICNPNYSKAKAGGLQAEGLPDSLVTLRFFCLFVLVF